MIRKVILCLTLVGLGVAGQAGRLPLAHAGGGNSDAAHACQHGGYASMIGLSGGQLVTFTNEGACVAFAAQGGTFTTPVVPCAVTTTSGCLTFNNNTLSSFSNGSRITLLGSTSFDDTCAGYCTQSVFPNAVATGGGDYVETNSSGSVISEGQYRIADTAGTPEGLVGTAFFDNSGNPTSCTAAVFRGVAVNAALVDAQTGATQTVEIDGDTNPNVSHALVFGTPDFFGVIPNTAITC
jgi:hypothetical protein